MYTYSVLYSVRGIHFLVFEHRRRAHVLNKARKIILTIVSHQKIN